LEDLDEPIEQEEEMMIKESDSFEELAAKNAANEAAEEKAAEEQVAEEIAIA